ncbi:MAG: heparinase II/III family protein, partial [Thermoleophilaceae bacterium]|nr:heparinase II/III family protein [Thermoleophilaceae bacterium]
SRSARVDGARAFFESGFAAIRDPGRGDLLALAAGYFNRWHKHADELSFELFASGTHVVADSGRVGKRLPGDYAGSATAHSTLTVDGVDFADRLRPFYGSGLDAIGEGDGWHALLAHNPRLLHQDVRHSRLLLYRPDVALIVVDQLDADEPHIYRRFVQLGPTVAVDRIGTGLGLSAPGPFAGRLSDAPAGEEVTIGTVRGQQTPPAGLLFSGFGQAVPRSMVGLRSEAADAVYALTIGLDGIEGTTATLEDSDRGDAVLVDTPGGALERVSIERRGREVRVSAGPVD